MMIRVIILSTYSVPRCFASRMIDPLPYPMPTCVSGCWLQAAGTQGPRRDSDCDEANALNVCQHL